MRASDVRRNEIVELVRAEGTTRVEDLVRRFGVTESTIRRDLARLTSEDRITRTFGGVMPATRHIEASLQQRLGEGHEAKAAIGRWAAGRIGAGEVALLDSGSTVSAVAEALIAARDVTVCTASLAVLNILSNSAGVDLINLGGRLRPLSQGFIGPLTEAAVERMSCDRLFLGTDGVSARGAICEADLGQIRLKELMVRRARHVYVLAHGPKIGASPFNAWLPLPKPWTLVTDASAPRDVLDALRADGVEIVVVDASATG
ncbi:DeoR/GlpR family DNA-binding transcription regulator [Microbacterium soli]|uniref:DeoR/GlpR family DNA-binding transcription regulator n=2 Tax=Microbacterium soli TaxID=446075 RepID=A0ABP7N9B0_9MICO